MSVLPSERSKISSFIVMDLLRAAAEKDRQLEASGTNQRVIHLEIGQPSSGPSRCLLGACCALCGTYTYSDAIRRARKGASGSCESAGAGPPGVHGRVRCVAFEEEDCRRLHVRSRLRTRIPMIHQRVHDAAFVRFIATIGHIFV